MTVQQGETKTVLLFQYGSNMSSTRLNGAKRLSGYAKPLGKAKLRGWELTFDIWSTLNESAAADIVPCDDGIVWGVLYDVDRELVIAPKCKLSKMDCIEGVRLDGTGNYKRRPVEIEQDDENVRTACTYLGMDAGRQRFGERCSAPITREYRSYVLDGAKEHGLPDGHCREIERLADRHNEEHSSRD